MMKHLKYAIIALFVIAITGSCGVNLADDVDPGNVLTASDLELSIVDTLMVGDTVGKVNARTNVGLLEYTLLSQNPESALLLNTSNGILTVGDASIFDAEVNPTITAAVSVTNQEMEKEIAVNLQLQPFVDTSFDMDGDGVLDEEDLDPNNPCVPGQNADYTAFEPRNEIWQQADCDSDGLLNGDEVQNGTDPYAHTLCETVNLSIWEGPMAVSSQRIGSNTIFDETWDQEFQYPRGEGCGVLTIPDLESFGCGAGSNSIFFRLIPEAEGATKGTVVVERQRQLCDAGGFILISEYSGNGTYDENEKVINVTVGIVFFFGGIVSPSTVDFEIRPLEE